MKTIRLVTIVIIASMFMFQAVAGHTPLDAEGEHGSLETALEIHDPTKSWTLYQELHEAAEPHYYRAHLEPREQLVVRLFTPLSEGPGFTPQLVVMGPDIQIRGSFPVYIEVPKAYAVTALISKRTTPEYEPFTPTSYHFLAEIRVESVAGGDYYFAVYEPDGGGRYGLAIGYREEFTLEEWVTTPLELFRIRLWEGQSPIVVFGPLVAAAAACVWLVSKRETIIGVHMWLGLAAASAYVATGVNMVAQMLLALAASGFSSGSFLTAIFVASQAGLGVMVLQKTLKERRSRTVAQRAVMAAYGLIGLFVWAGVIVGPVLALAAAAASDG
ncbi:MAG: hypothetical protein ABIJ47_10085 [Candidatus Bathyarchaeota archaeon]